MTPEDVLEFQDKGLGQTGDDEPEPDSFFGLGILTASSGQKMKARKSQSGVFGIYVTCI